MKTNSNITPCNSTKLSAISFASVGANADSSADGFYADAIKSYIRKGVVKRTDLDAPLTFDSVNPNFEARIFWAFASEKLSFFTKLSVVFCLLRDIRLRR